MFSGSRMITESREEDISRTGRRGAGAGLYPWKDRYRSFFRAVSCTLIIVFTFQQTVIAQEPSSWSVGEIVSMRPRLLPQDLTEINISSELARTKDASMVPGEEVIINIQDAHDSLGAQESIVGVLENLVANYDLEMIAMEGSGGLIDTTLLSSYPDRPARESAAYHFMRESKISAPEFFAAVTDRPVKIYGVEDMELYGKNVQLYRDLLEEAAKLNGYVESLRDELGQFAELLYPDEVKVVERNSVLLNNGELKFSEHWHIIKSLAERAGVNTEGYVNLTRLVQAVKLEKKVGFQAAENQRMRLIKELNSVVSRSDMEELVLKSILFRTGRLERSSFNGYLIELAEESGIEPGPYKDLIEYTKYITLYDGIDMVEIFHEMMDFEKDIKEKLFTSDLQRELSHLIGDLDVLSDLLNARITNRNYRYFMDNPQKFTAGRYSRFLKRISSRYGLPLPDVELSIIFENIPLAREFCRVAVERDTGMVRNTILRMRQENIQLAALVTGGFHSTGIAELLKSRELSYLVIMPRYDHNAPQRPYAAILTNRRNTVDRITETDGHKLALSSFLAADGSFYSEEFRAENIRSFIISVIASHLLSNTRLDARFHLERWSRVLSSKGNERLAQECSDVKENVDFAYEEESDTVIVRQRTKEDEDSYLRFGFDKNGNLNVLIVEDPHMVAGLFDEHEVFAMTERMSPERDIISMETGIGHFEDMQVDLIKTLRTEDVIRLMRSEKEFDEADFDHAFARALQIRGVVSSAGKEITEALSTKKNDIWKELLQRRIRGEREELGKEEPPSRGDMFEQEAVAHPEEQEEFERLVERTNHALSDGDFQEALKGLEIIRDEKQFILGEIIGGWYEKIEEEGEREEAASFLTEHEFLRDALLMARPDIRIHTSPLALSGWWDKLRDKTDKAWITKKTWGIPNARIAEFAETLGIGIIMGGVTALLSAAGVGFEPALAGAAVIASGLFAAAHKKAYFDLRAPPRDTELGDKALLFGLGLIMSAVMIGVFALAAPVHSPLLSAGIGVLAATAVHSAYNQLVAFRSQDVKAPVLPGEFEPEMRDLNTEERTQLVEAISQIEELSSPEKDITLIGKVVARLESLQGENEIRFLVNPVEHLGAFGKFNYWDWDEGVLAISEDIMYSSHVTEDDRVYFLAIALFNAAARMVMEEMKEEEMERLGIKDRDPHELLRGLGKKERAAKRDAGEELTSEELGLQAELFGEEINDRFTSYLFSRKKFHSGTKQDITAAIGALQDDEKVNVTVGFQPQGWERTGRSPFKGELSGKTVYSTDKMRDKANKYKTTTSQAIRLMNRHRKDFSSVDRVFLDISTPNVDRYIAMAVLLGFIGREHYHIARSVALYTQNNKVYGPYGEETLMMIQALVLKHIEEARRAENQVEYEREILDIAKVISLECDEARRYIGILEHGESSSREDRNNVEELLRPLKDQAGYAIANTIKVNEYISYLDVTGYGDGEPFHPNTRFAGTRTPFLVMKANQFSEEMAQDEGPALTKIPIGEGYNIALRPDAHHRYSRINFDSNIDEITESLWRQLREKELMAIMEEIGLGEERIPDAADRLKEELGEEWGGLRDRGGSARDVRSRLSAEEVILTVGNFVRRSLGEDDIAKNVDGIKAVIGMFVLGEGEVPIEIRGADQGMGEVKRGLQALHDGLETSSRALHLNLATIRDPMPKEDRHEPDIAPVKLFSEMLSSVASLVGHAKYSEAAQKMVDYGVIDESVKRPVERTLKENRDVVQNTFIYLDALLSDKGVADTFLGGRTGRVLLALDYKAKEAPVGSREVSGRRETVSVDDILAMPVMKIKNRQSLFLNAQALVFSGRYGHGSVVRKLLANVYETNYQATKEFGRAKRKFYEEFKTARGRMFRELRFEKLVTGISFAAVLGGLLFGSTVLTVMAVIGFDVVRKILHTVRGLRIRDQSFGEYMGKWRRGKGLEKISLFYDMGISVAMLFKDLIPREISTSLLVGFIIVSSLNSWISRGKWRKAPWESLTSMLKTFSVTFLAIEINVDRYFELYSGEILEFLGRNGVVLKSARNTITAAAAMVFSGLVERSMTATTYLMRTLHLEFEEDVLAEERTWLDRLKEHTSRIGGSLAKIGIFSALALLLSSVPAWGDAAEQFARDLNVLQHLVDWAKDVLYENILPQWGYIALLVPIFLLVSGLVYIFLRVPERGEGKVMRTLLERRIRTAGRMILIAGMFATAVALWYYAGPAIVDFVSEAAAQAEQIRRAMDYLFGGFLRDIKSGAGLGAIGFMGVLLAGHPEEAVPVDDPREEALRLQKEDRPLFDYARRLAYTPGEIPDDPGKAEELEKLKSKGWLRSKEDGYAMEKEIQRVLISPLQAEEQLKEGLGGKAAELGLPYQGALEEAFATEQSRRHHLEGETMFFHVQLMLDILDSMRDPGKATLFHLNVDDPDVRDMFFDEMLSHEDYGLDEEAFYWILKVASFAHDYGKGSEEPEDHARISGEWLMKGEEGYGYKGLTGKYGEDHENISVYLPLARWIVENHMHMIYVFQEAVEKEDVAYEKERSERMLKSIYEDAALKFNEFDGPISKDNAFKMLLLFTMIDRQASLKECEESGYYKPHTGNFSDLIKWWGETKRSLRAVVGVVGAEEDNQAEIYERVQTGVTGAEVFFISPETPSDDLFEILRREYPGRGIEDPVMELIIDVDEIAPELIERVTQHASIESFLARYPYIAALNSENIKELERRDLFGTLVKIFSGLPAVESLNVDYLFAAKRVGQVFNIPSGYEMAVDSKEEIDEGISPLKSVKTRTKDMDQVLGVLEEDITSWSDFGTLYAEIFSALHNQRVPEDEREWYETARETMEKKIVKGLAALSTDEDRKEALLSQFEAAQMVFWQDRAKSVMEDMPAEAAFSEDHHAMVMDLRGGEENLDMNDFKQILRDMGRRELPVHVFALVSEDVDIDINGVTIKMVSEEKPLEDIIEEDIVGSEIFKGHEIKHSDISIALTEAQIKFVTGNLSNKDHEKRFNFVVVNKGNVQDSFHVVPALGLMALMKRGLTGEQATVIVLGDLSDGREGKLSGLGVHLIKIEMIDMNQQIEELFLSIQEVSRSL